MGKQVFREEFMFLIFGVLLFMVIFVYSENRKELDNRVKNYLEGQRGKWSDWNVSEVDGQVLFDLILKNGYTNVLEIGTSTGHSTIWMAWALSKTNGKITTIEIDQDRHRKAIENIKKAGLEQYVETMLGDAHELIKNLEGPFDFIFSDADKEWYTNYAKILLPKLKPGGCFTAHNVLNGYGGIQDFLSYIKSQKNLVTTINRESNSGISISYKQ